MAAVGRRQEREVASFEEGELWCADDAVPPISPAGHYFRIGHGAWIGPFDDADAAQTAPYSGDPLRDARKYLERWQRGDVPPSPKIVALRRSTPTPPANADGQFELVLRGTGEAPERPRSPARRRAARAPQLPLALGL